jgi:hypothetical protein
MKNQRECQIVPGGNSLKCVSCKLAKKGCVFPQEVAQESPKSLAHKKRRTGSSVKPTHGKYS